MALDGKQVFEIINQIVADEEKRDEVTVLPLICGSGKSTAISYMIRQTIEQADETGNGLLVVTDRKDRMHDYMTPYDAELAEFLRNNKHKVTIMTRETVKDAYSKLKHAPVLMMTTQRYFRLSIEEINGFLQWEKGNRSLILLDERPELKTIVELNGKKLADCNEAIKASFPILYNKALEVWETKKHFENFVYDLQNSEICSQQDKLYCFWSWCNEFELENYKSIFDENFVDISKKRETINVYGGSENYEDIYTRIKAIRVMENGKALFSQRKMLNNVFEDKLSIILDNYSLVKNVNAKVIILDGTADLSPEYTIDSYDPYKAIDTKRSLDKLKIKLINIPTAKHRFNNQEYRKYVLDCVKLYYEENIAPVADEHQYAVFSYQLLQHDLVKLFGKRHVEHFGNIKGKNDFGQSKHIMQIGVNRFPDEIYYLLYSAHHPEVVAQFENANDAYDYFDEYEILAGEQIVSQSNKIEKQMSELTGQTRKIMNNMLLAEIEQNLFRGIIRNSDSEEDFTFHLFINTTAYEDLIKLMRDRYVGLGAQINEERLPIKTAVQKIMMRNEKTYLQLMIDWHDKQLKVGEEYTPKMIREALMMQGKKGVRQYERMIENCEVLRILLNSERKIVDGKEARGKYIKKANWQ